MRAQRPTASGNTSPGAAIQRAEHRALMVLYRTFVRRPESNQTDGVCRCASAGGQSTGTEVTDGLCLVVASLVFHRGVRGSAGHGADVHVRFPARDSSASCETRANCLVGRVLTAQRSVASDRQREARAVYQRELGSSRAPFFLAIEYTLSITMPPQQQTAHGPDSAAGARITPAIAEPT